MKRIILYLCPILILWGCETDKSDTAKPFGQRSWRVIYKDSQSYGSTMINQNGDVLEDSIPIHTGIGLISSGVSWSHDGKKIAYYTGAGLETSYLFMYDIEGRVKKNIAYCGLDNYYPKWHPNNDKLIAVYGFGLQKIVDTTGNHMEYPFGMQYPFFIDTLFQGDTLHLTMYNVSWNPKGDGFYIATVVGGQWRLYDVSFPSAQVRSLIAKRDNLNDRSVFISLIFESSPNGRWIMWNVEKAESSIHKQVVYVMNVDKTLAVEVGEGVARWSNDSDYLVFQQSDGVYAYNVNTGERNMLLDSSSITVMNAMLHFDDIGD